MPIDTSASRTWTGRNSSLKHIQKISTRFETGFTTCKRNKTIIAIMYWLVTSRLRYYIRV